MKGELIPTVLYADGRPRDVGTDRALANALNMFVDYKSAHQSPMLWTTGYRLDSGAMRAIPVFFGTEHMSATVERFVTLAPFYRSSGGSSVTLTVALTDMWPTNRPSKSATADVIFSGKYEMATWTTTSTTWATGADATLSLGVKDLNYGFAFLVMLVTTTGGSNLECRGMAKLIEGVRVVA
jgi:hypothetical protein